jgi:hypothetical protein
MTELQIIRNKIQELLEMTDAAIAPKPERVCNHVFGKCGRSYTVCPIKTKSTPKEWFRK